MSSYLILILLLLSGLRKKEGERGENMEGIRMLSWNTEGWKEKRLVHHRLRRSWAYLEGLGLALPMQGCHNSLTSFAGWCCDTSRHL